MASTSGEGAAAPNPKNFLKSFTFDIVKEWDFEKNRKHFPKVSIEKIKPQSGLKIWWLCGKGHSYDATVRHKNGGLQCPVCQNKKLLTGYNDVATLIPEVLEDWNKIGTNPDPSAVLATTSTIKVKMPCINGHYYETTPSAIRRGRKCPYCGGTKILEGFNDLAHKTPESLEWWDYSKNELKPSDVRYGSKVKYWFICPFKHSYQASPDKFSIGRRCPICAGKTVLEETSLAKTHPHIMGEWDFEKNIISPNEITAGFDGKTWWKCKKCNNSWQALTYNRTSKNHPQGCPKCAKGQTSSRGEKEILSFLQKNFNGEIITHGRITGAHGKQYELDMHIPEKKIAIEFNGVYYHSEKFVAKNYHHDKYMVCKENDIQLIQIWEDDWNLKRKIVERMLLHKISMSQGKIYARQTKARKITTLEAQSFLNENHIQGFVSSTITFGLFDTTDTLVASLSIKREDKGQTANIVRYATATTVVGGFTKLLKFIENTYSFKKFSTFSDNCVSDGSLYSNNGFTKEAELAPDYSYVVKNRREHKFNYRKERFKKDANLLYEAGLSERELAALNNINRVYDAGKIKWIKEVNSA